MSLMNGRINKYVFFFIFFPICTIFFLRTFLSRSPLSFLFLEWCSSLNSTSIEQKKRRFVSKKCGRYAFGLNIMNRTKSCSIIISYRHACDQLFHVYDPKWVREPNNMLLRNGDQNEWMGQSHFNITCIYEMT